MNWGNKLFVVFLVFGSMIAYMVFRCLNSSVDLVSKDYYQDELAYQQVIKGKLKAAALSSDVQVTKQSNSIDITLPAEMKHQPVSGSISFYCAAGSEKDRTMALHTNEEGLQQIPLKQLRSGTYIVKVRWHLDNNEYFSEQPVIIP